MSGCETTKLITQPIPPIYTQDCDKPMLEGNTYKDVIDAYVARGKAIDDCNAQKEALRRLSEEQ